MEYGRSTGHAPRNRGYGGPSSGVSKAQAEAHKMGMAETGAPSTHEGPHNYDATVQHNKHNGQRAQLGEVGSRHRNGNKAVGWCPCWAGQKADLRPNDYK